MLPKDDSFYTGADISTIKGMGEKYAASFYNKGIYNLFDLLLDFPFKYLDKTKISSIAEVRKDGEFYLIDAHIISVQNVATRRVKLLKLMLQDESGKIEAIFFNLYPNQVMAYTRGRRVLAFGPAKFNDYNGTVTLTQPTITFLDEDDEVTPQDRLTPVYHAVEKVPQASIRKAIESVLSSLPSIPLPEILPKEHNIFPLTLNEALDLIHYPYPKTDKTDKKFVLENSPQFKRICYEELIAYQLTLLSLKRKNDHHQAQAVAPQDGFIDKFLKTLPFELTSAQSRSYAEIRADLASSKPMLRLLHGDVGTGKTMVAMLASIQVAKSGFQTALLAPTELLAVQHYNKFKQLLIRVGLNVELLTSSIKGARRRQVLQDIADGNVDVVIGTHSVFQKDVYYKALVLAIIDEQHRFGVEQRLALLRKAPDDITMHQLVMTATPIPRTLQLALFSDLDVSTLDVLPSGRKPIVTAVVQDSRKGEVIARLKKVCSEGLQVYWVCPNIEETEDETESVNATFKELKKLLPELKIGLVHGQMPPKERNSVMSKFLEGKFSVLVATTIIEVGVDVPNASIIVIEGAHRLGLSQLHQLRGRVGRGSLESYCILMYHNDEDGGNDIAMQRLGIMKNTTDGFKIAREDLKMRGPGEVLGQKQAGFDIFKIVDVNRDLDLIEPARKAALSIISNDEAVTKSLIARWFPKFKI